MQQDTDLQKQIAALLRAGASEQEVEQWLAEQSKPEPSLGSRIGSALTGAAQGATFGFGDEIAAGMDALTHPVLGRGSDAPTMGQRYEMNLLGERKIDKDFEKRAPLIAGVADATGLVAGSLVAPLALPVAPVRAVWWIPALAPMVPPRSTAPPFPARRTTPP